MRIDTDCLSRGARDLGLGRRGLLHARDDSSHAAERAGRSCREWVAAKPYRREIAAARKLVPRMKRAFAAPGLSVAIGGRRQARLVGELRLRRSRSAAPVRADDAVPNRQRLEADHGGDRRAPERARTARRDADDSRLRRRLSRSGPRRPAAARRSSRRHPPLRGRRGDQHEALQLGHGQPPGLRRRPARRRARGAVPLLELRVQPARRRRRDGGGRAVRAGGRPRRCCGRSG